MFRLVLYRTYWSEVYEEQEIALLEMPIQHYLYPPEPLQPFEVELPPSHQAVHPLVSIAQFIPPFLLLPRRNLRRNTLHNCLSYMQIF